MREATQMQWDDARVFLAISRERSFSAAARRLGVQVSTVSRRLSSLEQQLGFTLVERSVSGYVLNRAGVELRQTAIRIEKEILGFTAQNEVANREIGGELRIAAIADMTSNMLMPIIARFSVAYPNIRLHIEVNNENVRLAEREADIALRQTNAPTETLIGTRLLSIASAVYGSNEYVNSLANGLHDATWIGVNCCEYHRTLTRQACPEDDQTLFVDDTALTASALREGAGIAYLPCYLGDADPKLIRIVEPNPDHNLGLWLLYHRDLRNTKRVTLFRSHIQKEIGALSDLFEGRTV